MNRSEASKRNTKVPKMQRLSDAIGLTREARVLVDISGGSTSIVHSSAAVYALCGRKFADLSGQRFSTLLALCPARMEEIEGRVASCARFTVRVRLDSVGEDPFDAVIACSPVVSGPGLRPSHVSIRLLRLLAENVPLPAQLLDAEVKLSLRAIVAALPAEIPLWSPQLHDFNHDTMEYESDAEMETF